VSVAPGVLLVVSGPSGAGKSTLVDKYVGAHPETFLAVSATTRERRASEVDGEDYHFLSQGVFQERLAAGGFLEHAEVHGNFYGTPREPVEEALAAGKDVILEIDVQGGRQVAAARPDTVLCFLTPSSQAELLHRLKGRAEDSDEVIQKRLRNAAKEYQALAEYHYRIINDELEQAYGFPSPCP
jgi:guanylate kinase